MCKSGTATRLKIDNTPSDAIVAKLGKLCEILQVIRDEYGKPIIVTSGYRCEALNTACGGASNSDHLYGCAADIRSLSDSPTDNKALFNLIVKLVNTGKIQVKQVIDEYHYDWIHVSYQDGRTSKRNQILHLS